MIGRGKRKRGAEDGLRWVNESRGMEER